MIVDVSYYWLLAEAVAWPVASVESFESALTAFTYKPVGVFDKITRKVADALEDRIRPMSRGFSLDALRQLRDRAWFNEWQLEGERSLTDYIGSIAAAHLEHTGSSVALRSDGDVAETAARWRWISLVLPADTCIAALCAREHKPVVENVHLAPPVLTQRLNQLPFAETHIHIGAAVTFGTLWSSLARVVTNLGFRVQDLRKDAAAPFGSNHAFSQRLIEAFITRILLAAFLRSLRIGYSHNFETFLRTALMPIGRSMNWGAGTSDAALHLASAVYALATPARSAKWTELRLLYRRLLGTPDRRLQHVSVFEADPLRTAYDDGYGSPEIIFQIDALTYLGCRNPPFSDTTDRVFAAAFWQYLRVRNITYRQLVEQPGTRGLEWFGRHYYRISPMRSGVDASLYRGALELQSGGLNLRALEMRTAPPSSRTELRQLIRQIAAQARAFGDAQRRAGRQAPEIGLVLHFIKRLDRASKARPAMNADPRSHLYGCRYGEWFHTCWRQTMAIEGVLRHSPEVLTVLRGIDVANAELAIPTWVLLPLFDRLQRTSRMAAARLDAAPPEWSAPPLRATLHAGEDYRTILEGLRRIHELMEFGVLRGGSRIGHAIALADDAPRWLMRIGGTLTQPAEERLDDLLWMLDRYLRRDIGNHAHTSRALEADVLRLGRLIYGDDIQVEDLLLARRYRHDPQTLWGVGYPFLREPMKAQLRRMPGWRRLLVRYLSSSEVFIRGQQPLEIVIRDEEVAFIEAAQKWLRRELASMEITIESNPSSNLLIGDMIALEHHPAFRLQPIDPNVRDARVLLSINTDNPITFATRLADEFAYIYYALLRNKAASTHDALEWVDRRRADGWHSRFTVPASADRSVLAHLETSALHKR